MTLEVEFEDKYVCKYLTDMEKYLAKYKGGQSHLHALISYIHRELTRFVEDGYGLSLGR